MKYVIMISLGVLVSCTDAEPPVCNTVQMTDSEYAAYEALPEADKPEHCAIQVIPDVSGSEVRFE